MKGIKVIYTPEEFASKGFDGEIAKRMMENRNTAIIGDVFGKDRHVIQFDDFETYMKYRENHYANIKERMEKRRTP